MFFNSWKTNVKLAWEVPRGTRTFIVQQLLAPGMVSARAEVFGRFVGFLRGLRSAPSHEVRAMVALTARDLRTVTGQNIRTVEEATGGLVDVWVASPDSVRAAVMTVETVSVPECDSWRLPYLGKLLEERQGLYYSDADREYVQQLIESLCI